MPRVIKRYANRKLYDVQASRYVSLEDLLELVRSGEIISVVDAASGEDLTSVTLAQVILERERSRRGGLPAAFLHQLVRHGEAWQDFVQTSMRASLEGLLTTQRQADAFFKDWAARAGLIVDEPEPAPTPRAPEPEPEPAPGAPPPSAAPEDEAEVDALRRQLGALEERLRALEAERGEQP
jgi:polyhydroxyalkanoate synthesis repressor PhaR